MTKRSRFVVGLVLGLVAGVGAVAYTAWAAFYDRVMEVSESRRINVEELSGTRPLELKITVETMESAPVIRSVTTRRRGESLTVLYHLSLAGLVKPKLGWQQPYYLAVPDSVNEVRFGGRSEIVWQRRKAAK